MKALEKINNDFKFITLEVSKQLKDAEKYLVHPDEQLLEVIISRDDFIDNLKGRIEDNCFSISLTGRGRPLGAEKANTMRAKNIIASNLERIADHAVNLVDQMQYLSERSVLDGFSFKPAFKELKQALSKIDSALENKDINLAMDICQCEHALDDIYTRAFEKIIEGIRSGSMVESRITLLFMMHYLERMGDAMLNVGEAIIFAIIGQKLKVHQYKALEESLATSDLHTSIGDVAFASIWGTRSGCRIGQIKDIRQDNGSRRVIFKKGSLKKLDNERQSIDAWQKIVPGLPPRIMSFQKNGRHATMLVEYLGNSTFQHMILNAPDELFKKAFLALQETLLHIWEKTAEEKPVNVAFSKQITARIQDVFSVHPSFKIPQKQIGAVSVFSFNERIKIIRAIDRELSAAFSVFAHGDFNIDNIIYDPKFKRIHFIDLNRSGRTDYVQDISVFLVSNFRQPIFESPLRHRLNTVIRSFYAFASDFARKRGDTSFDARLALGIARSLITSTRFELNTKFAQNMFLRSMYLLERLSEHRPAPWEAFVLPPETLIY